MQSSLVVRLPAVPPLTSPPNRKLLSKSSGRYLYLFILFGFHGAELAPPRGGGYRVGMNVLVGLSLMVIIDPMIRGSRLETKQS